LRLSKLILFILTYQLCVSYASAQEIESYLFPINPGQKNYLAGTMGELRSSHFHAGIDIKTGGQEGLAVLATKSGYITRIKTATGGYGHALYILHPDGNTSVYAHMKNFAPEVEAYLKQSQYEQQTYEIELFPEAGQFSFKRGEELGKSGNTGGSTGPHLHFEIRDPQQLVLNPLHYGFTEIKDNIPPIIQKLALTPRTANSRIANKHERKNLNLQRQGFNYAMKDTITAFGELGIELLGHDKLDGAANKNGVSIIEVRINDDLYYTQNIDSMSFSNQRHIMVHYPYDISVKEGSRYHRLYTAEGNQLDFYKAAANQGWINVLADSIYHINISMYDPYKNKSTLTFSIKGQAPDTLLYEKNDFELDQIAYTIEGNTLKVFLQTECLSANNTELSIKLPNDIVGIKPSYYLEETAVYLWDLSMGLPESVLSCGAGLSISEKVIYSKTTSTISTDYMKVEFTPYSLFSAAYVNTGYQIENADSIETFSIQPETYPLMGSITMTLKPKLRYLNNKTSVYQRSGEGDFSYVGGDWNSDSTISFNTRGLGDYTLLTDSIAPTIKRTTNNLAFIINDDLSGIKSYHASLDGKWVLLKYESKDNLIWVDWLNKKQAKTGSFQLIVTDQAGNENTMNFNLK
jgi:hypothetical protein